MNGSACLGCGALDHCIAQCPHVNTRDAQLASAYYELDPDGVVTAPVSSAWTASVFPSDTQVTSAPTVQQLHALL